MSCVDGGLQSSKLFTRATWLATVLVVGFLALSSRPLVDELSIYAMINGVDIWSVERFIRLDGQIPSPAETLNIFGKMTSLGQGGFPAMLLLLIRGMWFQLSGWVGYQVEAIILVSSQVFLNWRLIQALGNDRAPLSKNGLHLASLATILATLTFPTQERAGIAALAVPPASFGWYGLLVVPTALLATYVVSKTPGYPAVLLTALVVSAFNPFSTIIFPILLVIATCRSLLARKLEVCTKLILGVTGYFVGTTLWYNNFYLWEGLANREMNIDLADAINEFWQLAISPRQMVFDFTFWAPVIGIHSALSFFSGVWLARMSGTQSHSRRIIHQRLFATFLALLVFRIVVKIMEMPSFTYSAWWHDGSTAMLASIWFVVFGSCVGTAISNRVNSTIYSVVTGLLVAISFSCFLPNVIGTRVDYAIRFDSGDYLGQGSIAASGIDQFQLAALSLPGRLLPAGAADVPQPPYTLFVSKQSACSPSLELSDHAVNLEVADASHQLLTGVLARASIEISLQYAGEEPVFVRLSGCKRETELILLEKHQPVEVSLKVHEPLVIQLVADAENQKYLDLGVSDVIVRSIAYVSPPLP